MDEYQIDNDKDCDDDERFGLMMIYPTIMMRIRMMLMTRVTKMTGTKSPFTCVLHVKYGISCKAIFATEEDIYTHLNHEHHTTKWLVHEFVRIQN